MEIIPGLKGRNEVQVDETNVACAMGSGSLPVFATPALAAAMENAALSSVQPCLDEGYTTVGIKLDLDHVASTPTGMTVVTESELVAVEGKILTFKIESRVGEELIGTCLHKRAVVAADRFLKKAEAKRG